MGAPRTQIAEESEYLYSPVVEGAANASFGSGPGLTWDSFVRKVYQGTGQAIQQQANALLARGNVTRRRRSS